MAWRTQLVNLGSVLVGVGVADYVKKYSMNLGPVKVDGRLLVGLGSILLSEYVPQVRMNATYKAVFDIVGALNLGTYLYDLIMSMMAQRTVSAPVTAQTVQAQTQTAQAVVPVMARAPVSVGRIV